MTRTDMAGLFVIQPSDVAAGPIIFYGISCLVQEGKFEDCGCVGYGTVVVTTVFWNPLPIPSCLKRLQY
jgi:hypothetical protein